MRTRRCLSVSGQWYIWPYMFLFLIPLWSILSVRVRNTLVEWERLYNVLRQTERAYIAISDEVDQVRSEAPRCASRFIDLGYLLAGKPPPQSAVKLRLRVWLLMLSRILPLCQAIFTLTQSNK